MSPADLNLSTHAIEHSISRSDRRDKAQEEQHGFREYMLRNHIISNFSSFSAKFEIRRQDRPRCSSTSNFASKTSMLSWAM
jgi:hypothetical protein